MIAVESQSVCFEPDNHAYTGEGGIRVPSVTQILQLSGAISYAGIKPDVLAHASWRGTLVHEACELWDQGVDVEDEMEIPAEVLPYFQAWQSFAREFDFVPDLENMEKPRIANVHGFVYGMKPDAPGWVNGIPTIVERKATAAKHASWGLQLAAYEAGLPRPKGCRNYQRLAVQLKPDGTFQPHVYQDPHDLDVFCHKHGSVTWNLNQRLQALAA